jgi:hypothetical protein
MMRQSRPLLDARKHHRQRCGIGVLPKLVPDHATENGGPYGDLAECEYRFLQHLSLTERTIAESNIAFVVHSDKTSPGEQAVSN